METKYKDETYAAKEQVRGHMCGQILWFTLTADNVQ